MSDAKKFEMRFTASLLINATPPERVVGFWQWTGFSVSAEQTLQVYFA